MSASTFNPDGCPEFKPCYDPDDCWDSVDSLSCTSCCWKVVWSLTAIGAVLVAYGDVCATAKSPVELLMDYIQKLRKQRREMGQHQLENPDMTHSEIMDHMQKMQERKQNIFVTTNVPCRTLANFTLNHNDPRLLIPEKPDKREYDRHQFSVASYSFSLIGMIRNLAHILTHQYVHAILWSSLGFGLLSSAMSTYLWLIKSHDEFCVDQGYSELPYNTLVLDQYWDVYIRLRRDYLSLVVFLMIFYVAYVANRWRDLLRTCHSVQIDLHTIAMCCGGSVKVSSNQNLKDADLVRRKLHKVYRYLNCIHAMTYKTVSPTLQSMSIEKDFVETLGLLTREEVDQLGPELSRPALLSWLATAIHDFEDTKSTVDGKTHLVYEGKALDGLEPLREHCSQIVNSEVVGQPNSYLDVMFVSTTLLMILILVGEIGNFVYVGRNTEDSHLNKALFMPCFQPLVIVGVVLLTSAVRLLFLTIRLLQDPFRGDSEQILVDQLMATTERCMFLHMRANFHADSATTTTISDETIDKKAIGKSSSSNGAGEKANWSDESYI